MLIASLTIAGKTSGFHCRDQSAAVVGSGWGVGSLHPVVLVPQISGQRLTSVPDDFFERAAGPGDRVIMISSDPGRPAGLFGTGLVSRILKPNLEAVGLWKPGQLQGLHYSDRYVKAPLPALLLVRTAAALRDALAEKGKALPLTVTTERLRGGSNRRPPCRVGDNWEDERDRVDTIIALAERFNVSCSIASGSAPHGRKLVIDYADGSKAILLFDQGFGYWSASGGSQHNFRAAPISQARSLHDLSALIAGSGESYVALTSR